MATGGEKSATESNASPQHNDKRKHAEMSSDERATESEDETLTSKINRLASEDSLNDEDFNVSIVFFYVKKCINQQQFASFVTPLLLRFFQLR